MNRKKSKMYRKSFETLCRVIFSIDVSKMHISWELPKISSDVSNMQLRTMRLFRIYKEKDTNEIGEGLKANQFFISSASANDCMNIKKCGKYVCCVNVNDLSGLEILNEEGKPFDIDIKAVDVFLSHNTYQSVFELSKKSNTSPIGFIITWFEAIGYTKEEVYDISEEIYFSLCENGEDDDTNLTNN